jgi:hypothetical protein
LFSCGERNANDETQRTFGWSLVAVFYFRRVDGKGLTGRHGSYEAWVKPFSRRSGRRGDPSSIQGIRIKTIYSTVAEIDSEVKNYLQREDILSYKDSLGCG